MIAKVIIHESQNAILNIYVTLHATLTNKMNTIAKSLRHLHLNKISIIIGDFNIDMLQSNDKTKKIENYMCNYNLHLLLDKINHVQKILIDHVWLNVPSGKSKLSILDTYWNDHDTIHAFLYLNLILLQTIHCISVHRHLHKFEFWPL